MLRIQGTKKTNEEHSVRKITSNDRRGNSIYVETDINSTFYRKRFLSWIFGREFSGYSHSTCGQSYSYIGIRNLFDKYIDDMDTNGYTIDEYGFSEPGFKRDIDIQSDLIDGMWPDANYEVHYERTVTQGEYERKRTTSAILNGYDYKVITRMGFSSSSYSGTYYDTVSLEDRIKSIDEKIFRLHDGTDGLVFEYYRKD